MKYNLDNIIDSLFVDLNGRHKDVLQSRYGLKSGQRLTLASIGNRYQITRERIRQIEALALSSLRAQFAKGDLNKLTSDIKNHFTKHGNLHREADFYNEFKRTLATNDNKTYANKIFFLLECSGLFNYYPEDNHYYSFWYTDQQAIKKADVLINKLVATLNSKKEDLLTKNNFDGIFSQAIKSLNYPRSIALNFLSISKKFSANAYNDFGLSYWPEICPKTSRDWAYLVLRKKGKPLHFTELTAAINQLRSNKKTNAQTVHNELIKDQRFVLIGRGTYGIKEFNLMAGTAREVIAQIIERHGPKKSKELIQLVLNKRMFKENTLLLNLQDRRYFQRMEDGRYTIKKV